MLGRWGGRTQTFFREEALHPPPSPPTVPAHSLALHTFLGYKRPSTPLGAVTRKEKQLSYPFPPLEGGSLGEVEPDTIGSVRDRLHGQGKAVCLLIITFGHTERDKSPGQWGGVAEIIPRRAKSTLQTSALSKH